MDRNMNRQTIEQYNEQYIQEVLDKMNRCDTRCTDLGSRPLTSETKTLASVDWLKKNLPAYEYVLDRTVNYIFSNNLVTGDEAGNKKLDEWLYAKHNRVGATNYAVLREAVGMSMGDGECGIRELDGNIYQLPVGYYGLLMMREDGIEQVVAYYIRKDGSKVTETISKKQWADLREYADVPKWFDDKGYILLDPEHFMVLRNNPANIKTESVLLSDQQRVNLLVNVYSQLNYDVTYDGIGRVFFRMKSGFLDGEGTEISTGTVLNNLEPDKEKRISKGKEEVGKLMTEIKNSSTDTVGVLSDLFDGDPIHFPRVTKATEFLDWLEVDTTIMAQLFGMSPTLLEIGKLNGNISVEKVIDNSMLNTMIPKRESLATQFSDFLARIVGVNKVYFDKYDLQQVKDENEDREKIARVVNYLSTAYKNTENEEIRMALDDVTRMLRESVYDEAGEIKPL